MKCGIPHCSTFRVNVFSIVTGGEDNPGQVVELARNYLLGVRVIGVKGLGRSGERGRGFRSECTLAASRIDHNTVKILPA
jgi:hypothetical protein